MARITVDDCLREVPNRFHLVHTASARTKQLLTGSKPRVAPRREKPIVVALREIAARKVHLKLVEREEPKPAVTDELMGGGT